MLQRNKTAEGAPGDDIGNDNAAAMARKKMAGMKAMQALEAGKAAALAAREAAATASKQEAQRREQELRTNLSSRSCSC